MAARQLNQRYPAPKPGEERILVGDVPLGGGIGIGVRKSNSEMRDRFDAAITTMKKDGSLNALIAKGFPGKKGF